MWTKTQGGHEANENEHQMERRHAQIEYHVHRQPHGQSTPGGQEKYKAPTQSAKE